MFTASNRFLLSRFARCVGVAGVFAATSAAARPLVPEMPDSIRDQPEYVRVAANVDASTDFYGSSGVPARLSPYTMRFMLRPTIYFGDDAQIPADVYVTSSPTSYQQPFTQIGVNPRVGTWLTGHGGYFYNRFSDLSIGDVRVLGAGIDLTPGLFRFSALYGITRQPRTPDPSVSFLGEYQRIVYAAKLAYGNEDDAFVSLNLAHGVDIMSSAPTLNTSLVPPNENLVISLSGGNRFGPTVHMYAELAASAFSNDITIAPIANVHVVPKWLFTLRTSSQLDGAAKLGLAITPSRFWSVRLNSQWIGPGYTTLGYAQLPNDVFETTIAPDVRLFSGSLIMRASAGLRLNNLRSNRVSTTRRIIGSFNASATVTEHFGFDAQYSNYGMRTANNSINNIYQYVNIGPRWTFTWFRAAHSLMAMYGFQDASVTNLVPALTQRTQSTTGTLIHSMCFASTWSFSTTGFYNRLWTSGPKLTVASVNETVGRQFANGKVSVTLTGGYGVVQASSREGQIIGRASLTYRVDRFGAFTANVSSNNYDYTLNPAANFREMQASLQYTLSI